MITTMQQLYDHVNRYHIYDARMGSQAGRLSIYSTNSVGLELDIDPPHSRKPLDPESLVEGTTFPLEMRNPDGEWVPIWEYDDQAVEVRIDRFEALHLWEMAAQNYGEVTRRLRELGDRMDPRDRPHFPVPDFPAVKCPTDEYRDSIR